MSFIGGVMRSTLQNRPPRSVELGQTLFAPLPPSHDGGWNGYGSHYHDHGQIPWDEVIVHEYITHARSRKKPD